MQNCRPCESHPVWPNGYPLVATKSCRSDLIKRVNEIIVNWARRSNRLGNHFWGLQLLWRLNCDDSTLTLCDADMTLFETVTVTFFFKKTGQSRPLFVYFRSFHIPIQMTNIWFKVYKLSVDVLGIRTRNRRMVGADDSTELGRPPSCDVLCDFFEV